MNNTALAAAPTTAPLGAPVVIGIVAVCQIACHLVAGVLNTMGLPVPPAGAAGAGAALGLFSVAALRHQVDNQGS